MKKERIYDEPAVTVPVSPLAGMTASELMRAMASGAAVGLVGAIAMTLMNKFIFSAVLCRPQSVADCAQAPTYAMIVAMVLSAIVGLILLARMRVYRPLLIVLAATVALWGISTVLSTLVWYWALLAAIVFFALAYGLFSWAARIRNFILAVVVTVVLIVVVRLFLMA